MNHEAAVSIAKDIADRVLAPAARQNDKDGRFSSEAIKAFGPAGLLGLMLPADIGGSALGPRTFAAVVSALAEADASVAMVYLMHACAVATIAAARDGATVAPTLKEIAAGRHLSTLAFSETGSRSHFWAPVSRARRNAAGVHITAKNRDSWSDHRCRPIAMRDTDLGWMTMIVAASGGPVSGLSDLKGRTLALGSRDSGHAAILPVYFLEREGLTEGRDYRALRFDSDVGKHGDTGASEVEVVRSVLDGRADAGAIGSPFWKTVRAERLVPEGALTEIWTSPPYNHCMFTSRPDLDPSVERRFAEALSGMNYDNPTHRAVLDAEGLHHWVEPHLDGYTALREACVRQGLFTNAAAKSAAE